MPRISEKQSQVAEERESMLCLTVLSDIAGELLDGSIFSFIYSSRHSLPPFLGALKGATIMTHAEPESTTQS